MCGVRTFCTACLIFWMIHILQFWNDSEKYCQRHYGPWSALTNQQFIRQYSQTFVLKSAESPPTQPFSKSRNLSLWERALSHIMQYRLYSRSFQIKQPLSSKQAAVSKIWTNLSWTDNFRDTRAQKLREYLLELTITELLVMLISDRPILGLRHGWSHMSLH